VRCGRSYLVDLILIVHGGSTAKHSRECLDLLVQGVQLGIGAGQILSELLGDALRLPQKLLQGIAPFPLPEHLRFKVLFGLGPLIGDPSRRSIS
jgi:hypothetical protein